MYIFRAEYICFDQKLIVCTMHKMYFEMQTTVLNKKMAAAFLVFIPQSLATVYGEYFLNIMNSHGKNDAQLP